MDHSSKIKLLKQLARTGGKIADNTLEKEAAKISAALENETRFDLLEQQIDLLDNFAFRVPETAVGIVRQFLERLKSLELTRHNNIGSPTGNIAKFQNNNRLTIEILKLLNRIRYHKFEDVLGIFVLYSNHEDTKVREQVNQCLKNIAEYNIDIYYDGKDRAGYGPAPQLKLLEWLEALDTAARQQNSLAITELCISLLSPSMHSTTSDYKTVTWSSTPIPATDQIIDIRRRGLRLLKQLYGLATSTSDKMSVINAMLVATQTPHQGDYGDDLLDMVLENALEVLTFFKEILPEENLQIIQKIEHDAFWQYRRAPRDDVKSAALEIRDHLANHDEYNIYKTLIGFDGVFEEWEESRTKNTGYTEIQKYRSERAKEYVDTINAENWFEWRDRILKFSTTESDDLATFPSFFEFLQYFAEKSPDLAFGLLRENLSDIRLFTGPLLRGLWKGPRKSDLRALMLEWIAADQQLIAITKLFLSNDDIDEEILRILLDKGAADANRDILMLVVAVVASNYTSGRESLVPTFFLPAVGALTKLKDTRWVRELWYRDELSDILANLGDEGREIILGGLLVGQGIDYHEEELLIPLAEDNPARIMAFFRERLQYEDETKQEGRYDAIPFQFHKLHESLSHFPELAVDTVRSWFDGDETLFQYRGANLLKIIFPDFAEPFEAKLLGLVRTGERQDINFVLSVMRNYQSEPFLHGICKEIVATLPRNDELNRVVLTVLYSTGVVVGEFGFAEAYERKIEEIKPWLNDENEKVRKFTADYVAGLENQAKSERRRAEEEIELRKHTYGVREEKAEDENG